jgi:ABC-type transport system substrate-binding protein
MTVTGPLATPEARQAMCWAFPYEEVIQGVHKGVYAKQARGAVPEVLNGFYPDVFTYATDLAKAKELLTQAGVSEGTELTLQIESGDEDVKTEAQLFQANLAEIGIKLTVLQTDTPTHQGTIYGEAPPEERPNFMWWGWWPDYNDSWNHLDPQISCDKQGSAGSNAGFYCNERVDELMKQSKDAVDLAVYNDTLAEIQQIISRDDPPSIYYIQPLWTTIARRDVTGVFINPINLGTFNFWKMSRTTA